MKIDGKTVIDAKEPVVIHVKPIDVERGNTKDPGGCAAARACMRELHATAARVHIGRTYLKFEDKWIRFHTSRALRSEIVAFDRGGKFEPGEYTLSPMQPAKRMGKRQGTPSKAKRGRKRAKPHLITGIRAHGANR